MDNVPPQAAPGSQPPSAAAAAPKRSWRKLVLKVIGAAIGLVLLAVLLFFWIPPLRTPIFVAGCFATIGMPEVGSQMCGQSFRCLTFLPASDAGQSCGSDLDCQGACLDMREAPAPAPAAGGLDLGLPNLPQFGYSNSRGRCAATRSLISYWARQPGCGL